MDDILFAFNVLWSFQYYVRHLWHERRIDFAAPVRGWVPLKLGLLLRD